MKKEQLSKFFLAFSDFFWCFISFPISITLIALVSDDLYRYIPASEIYNRVFYHLVISIICVGWFWLRLRHYTYRKPFWFELKEILRTLIIFSIIGLAVVAFSKQYFSRYVWVITWLVVLFFVPFFRYLTKSILIRNGIFLKKTIIIGGGKNALDTYLALNSESYLGLKVKYFIANEFIPEVKDLPIPIIKNDTQGVWELVSSKSDQFLIALEDNDDDEKDKWLRKLIKQGYRFVSVIPTLRGLPLYSTDISFLFSYEILFLRINNNLAKRSSQIVKRVMDISVSSFLLVILSPALVVIYAVVLFSGGSPLYKHKRIGKKGKEFYCWKFRTMCKNSDTVLKRFLEANPDKKSEWELERKLKDDPRITKIGNFLRKWSLDELPQLYNVLIGQMSLVGPRPVVKKELGLYCEDVDYYLMAKPGMTGLWQVSGRNDVDYDTRVYFDTWYVKNWSLWNDIAILFKTFKVVLNQKGSY